jgi:hypothetical protein
LWHPDMFNAKETTGHQLYEQMRGLRPDDPRFQDLLDQQRTLYADAIKNADQGWRSLAEGLAAGGSPAVGKAARNAASDMGRPESITSAASASRQLAPEAGRNQAESERMTAGLDSQSKNVVSIDGDFLPPVVGTQAPALDFTSPAPEPPVEGLDDAAARVGHQDTPASLREMFGLKDDGSFDEQADIDQYREMGILDEADEKMLALADDAVKAADAYGETLRVAASCMVR